MMNCQAGDSGYVIVPTWKLFADGVQYVDCTVLPGKILERKTVDGLDTIVVETADRVVETTPVAFDGDYDRCMVKRCQVPGVIGDRKLLPVLTNENVAVGDDGFAVMCRWSKILNEIDYTEWTVVACHVDAIDENGMLSITDIEDGIVLNVSLSAFRHDEVECMKRMCRQPGMYRRSRTTI